MFTLDICTFYQYLFWDTIRICKQVVQKWYNRKAVICLKPWSSLRNWAEKRETVIQVEFKASEGHLVFWNISRVQEKQLKINQGRRPLRKKCPNTEFFVVRIFHYSDWIRRLTEEISVFSPNTGKYGPEKLRILTIFTQWTRLDWAAPVQNKERGDDLYQTLMKVWNSSVCTKRLMLFNQLLSTFWLWNFFTSLPF